MRPILATGPWSVMRKVMQCKFQKILLYRVFLVMRSISCYRISTIYYSNILRYLIALPRDICHVSALIKREGNREAGLHSVVMSNANFAESGLLFFLAMVSMAWLLFSVWPLNSFLVVSSEWGKCWGSRLKNLAQLAKPNCNVTY